MFAKLNSSKVVLIIVALIITGIFARYMSRTPKVVNGETAPDFSALTAYGDSMRLSDLRGKYVLLDFWGSWCGPCLAESPSLVQLYHKFHGQHFEDADDFEIVSVGIERKKENWLGAIQYFGLNWKYHVSDANYFDSEAAKKYGVRVIPTKFLLNKDGIIIGVNQSVEEIDKLLEQKRLKN